jgi:GNAT superfamily N-acetyltransferase
VRAAGPGDAAGIASVHVDSWRTTYRGLVPDEHLAGLSYARGAAQWGARLGEPAGGTFVYVAEDATGAIVGFAAGGPASDAVAGYDGELHSIYLLAAAQGHGLGRRLVAAVARRLAEQGMGSMLVWVLAGSPARQFYEALGGHPIAEQPIAIGGAPLREVAYGWPDLAPLLAAGGTMPLE